MQTSVISPEPAKVLREMLDQDGRQQKDIARAAGMSEPQLSRLAKGKRTLRLEAATDLQDVLRPGETGLIEVVQKARAARKATPPSGRMNTPGLLRSLTTRVTNCFSPQPSLAPA